MNQSSAWGPVQQQMTDLLQGYPDDVPAVVDQLTELQKILGAVPPLLRENPLGDFNRLYLTITECVLDRLYAGQFEDPAFLSRLDVEFAGRYFDALRAWAGAGASPRCPEVWAVLFRRVPGPGSRPLPSARAGVNAHLTFDLPFALVTTFDHLGTDPIDDSEQHHDYLSLNDIFAAAVPGLPEAVGHTRDAAWRNAQKLWGMRHDMAATARARSDLDRTAAGLNALLLSPLGSVLP